MTRPSSHYDHSETYEYPHLDLPDECELTVLNAMRAWLRPTCDAAHEPLSWEDILYKAGLRADGIEHFDWLMRGLLLTSMRPLDTRCRCASALAKDEASLLQTLALLQITHTQAAVQLLGEWLPQPAVSGLVKVARWLAIDLLEAGLKIRVRQRSVTYMH